MAFNDNLLNANTAKGLAVGLGVAAVAVSTFSGRGRPIARVAIKSGIIVYDKGREALAEMGEVFEDLVAEAQAELEESRNRAGEEGEQEAPPPSREEQ